MGKQIYAEQGFIPVKTEQLRYQQANPPTAPALPRVATREELKASVRTAYTAGPMTGLPNYNYDAFDEVEAHLISNGLPGYTGICVVNPANNFGRDQSLPRRVYLAKCMQQVAEADALVLLPDWYRSEGAQLEVTLALNLGKDFYVAWKRSTDGSWEVAVTSAEIVQTILEDLGGQAHEPIAEPLADWERELLESGVPFVEMAAETIEQEASRLVRNGQRQKDYGHPRGDFDQVARYWSADLHGKLKDGAAVDAYDVAQLMISLKKARLKSNPHHRDSKVDIIGYTICHDRLDEPEAA